MLLRESVGIRWICEVNRGRAGFGGGEGGGGTLYVQSIRT